MSKSKQDGSKMTEEDFERQMSVVFATCWNRLDFTHLIAYLAVDVVYESQNVFQALTGRKEVFDYLCEKAETIRKSESDTQVSAELATLDQKHGLRPCVLLSQGSRGGCKILSVN